MQQCWGHRRRRRVYCVFKILVLIYVAKPLCVCMQVLSILFLGSKDRIGCHDRDGRRWIIFNRLWYCNHEIIGFIFFTKITILYLNISLRFYQIGFIYMIRHLGVWYWRNVNVLFIFMVLITFKNIFEGFLWSLTVPSAIVYITYGS